MYTLYEYPPSGNCYKVRLLIWQLGIPFERIVIDTQSNQTRTPDFLDINPNGKVPALRLPDGTILAESNAMLWYLAVGSALIPETRLGRAQVLQWMFFEQYSHEPYVATLRNWIAYANKREVFAARIEEFRPRGYAALGVMEQHLSRNRFLVEDAYSIADITLYAYTHVAHEGEGFILEVISETAAVMYWFTYAPQEGRQVWMLGVGSIEDDQIHFDEVLQPFGARFGNDFDPELVNESQWGTGTLTADNCESIHMVLVPNEASQGAGFTNLEYDLVRLTTPAISCP
jgi:glutathione S-transferase